MSVPNSVTQLIAGTNISLSPTTGTGQVTVSSSAGSLTATGPGSTAGAYTGSAVTIPAPTGFRLYWGVLNQSTVTITMPTPVADTAFVLRLDQDSVGSRQVAFASNPVVNDPTGQLAFSGLVATGFQSTSNTTNWVRFESDGQVWYGFLDTPGPPSISQADQARFSLAVVPLRPVVAVATSNISSLSGLQAVDGYTPNAGDPDSLKRVLLTAQTTASQNGVWVQQTGAWYRPSDYPTGGKINGAQVLVLGGTVNTNTTWTTVNTTTVAVDTGNTTWTVGGGASVGSTLPTADASPSTAGVATTAARSDHAHPRTVWAPGDYSWLSWSYDIVTATIQATLTAGTLYFTRLHLPTAQTITNILLMVSTAGATPTANQNFAGIYNSAGTSLLASTAAGTCDALTSTGQKTLALSSTYAATAGDYLIAWFFNYTTMPKIGAGVNNPGVNGSLAGANARFGAANTALTTALPASMTSPAPNANSFWAGIS